MNSTPPRPSAESIRPQEVVKRIVETKAADAWSMLRETILTRPRHSVPDKD